MFIFVCLGSLVLYKNTEPRWQACIFIIFVFVIIIPQTLTKSAGKISIVVLCRWRRKSRLFLKCWLLRRGTWQRSSGSWESLHSMSLNRTWARAGRKSLHPQRTCPIATCALWVSLPVALEEQLHLSLHHTPHILHYRYPSAFRLNWTEAILS